jgi:hypothetical protein
LGAKGAAQPSVAKVANEGIPVEDPKFTGSTEAEVLEHIRIFAA